MLKLIAYDEEFLLLSWKWLNDPEIKKLTMTPDFSKEDQVNFFNSIKLKKNYKIFGIEFNNKKIGACGLKNIEKNKAEYWGYLGEKEYWGKGLGKEIVMKIESLATKEKISIIYLKVQENNLRAIKLYEKIGFIQKCNKDDYIIMDKCI